MSLEDKFKEVYRLHQAGMDGVYAGIEKTINKVDEKYLALTSHLVEKWQNTTYRTKNDLQTGLNLCAFANFGVYYAMNPSDYFSLFFTAITGLTAVLSRIQNPDTNRIIQEQKRTLASKGGMAFALTGAAVTTALTVPSLILGYVNSDVDQYIQAIDLLSTGIGTFSAGMVWYVTRVNPGDPPKRPKKKPLTERMKEALEQLTPEPVHEPIKINS